MPNMVAGVISLPIPISRFQPTRSALRAAMAIGLTGMSGPMGHDYIASHIQWRVNNQVIYIHFIEDNYDVEIHDYRLSDNFFTGTIYMGGQTVDFRLRHVDSPNWDDYYYGYDYYAKPQLLQMPKQRPMRVLQP